MSIALKEWMRRCIEECKTCGNLNTASSAERLIEKFAGRVDETYGELSKEIGSIDPYADVELTSQQAAACKEFAALFANVTGDADAFLFFTDPHTVHPSGMLPKFYESLNQIAAVYHKTPTSMCICGGDWLNDSNAKDNAAWCLGGIDGAMKRRFDNYLLIVGNHDTNYQGYDYMQSGADGTYDRDEHTKCILSDEAIRSLWHRDRAASYFDVKIDSGTYYVFDTGIDWYPDMDEYRWKQIDWFASKLLEDNPQNCAGLLHIPQSSTPFISCVTQIGEALNARSIITLNDKTYDFSGATGKFRFVIAGHTHKDAVNVVNGIPVVTTKNLQAADEYCLDLMLADYAAKTLRIVRVGDGENRTVEMADASVINLFKYGVKTDYNFQNKKPVTATSNDSFTVNADEGYLRCVDMSGNAAAFFKNDLYQNDGSTFTVSADFVNETEGNTPSKLILIRAFIDADNVYNGAIANTVFKAFYDAHQFSGDSFTFTLPPEVTAFQVGFVFDSIENNSDYIRITNVSLTKN